MGREMRAANQIDEERIESLENERTRCHQKSTRQRFLIDTDIDSQICAGRAGRPESSRSSRFPHHALLYRLADVCSTYMYMGQ